MEKQSSARRNMRAQILKNAGSLVRAQLWSTEADHKNLSSE